MKLVRAKGLHTSDPLCERNGDPHPLQACVGLPPARCLILTLRKINILLDCELWDAAGAWGSTNQPLLLGPCVQVRALCWGPACILGPLGCQAP